MKMISFIVVALVLMIIAGCGTAPAAPTGLTVTATAPITLSWNSYPDAVSYNIYRGTVSGDLSTKTILASNFTAVFNPDTPALSNVITFTDKSAIAGATYFYQVTGVNHDGTLSAASNEVSATTQPPLVLAGIKDVSQIILNWGSVSGAVSYNVYRSTISSIITDKTKLSIGNITTTFSDAAVTSGTTYYYQVTVVNANGFEFQVSDEALVVF